MSAHSRRLQSSLASSWGDADYSSDGGASIHSASDEASEVDLEDSDKEVLQTATPLAPRTTRTSSTHPDVTPVKKPLSKSSSQYSQGPRTTPRPSKRLAQSTPGLERKEPSFIMPSLDNSISDSFDGSPMRSSQVRNRKSDRPSSRRKAGASPRAPGRQTPLDPPQEQKELGPWYYVDLFYRNIALPLAAYIFDIFAYAMRHFVKPVLGVVLGLGIIYLGFQAASVFLYSTLSSALTPVCLIPGSSYILPFCSNTEHETQRADFEELINVQSRFEDILDASKDTSTLPATIKDSEIAIRDLRTLVRHSRLPSRSQLDLEFANFVLTANEASVDLSRYNSRIGATMDRVIATNTWTMAVLSGISEKEASVGAVSRAFSSMTGVFIAPPPTLQQRIFDQYLLHVSQNKEEITRLIETAQALLQVLQNLDERLDTIYQIATNDDTTITKNQDELLSSLWTKLGGNSASVRANKSHLHLLRDIAGYRRKALKHVSQTLLKLQEIQAQLENLREGVAAPEVLGWRDEVPLTYHLDVIEKAVDRLRVSRGESMRVEGDNYRRMIRGGEDEGGFKELPGRGVPVVTVKAK
ncbi:hypothetical protein P153DRAFT_343515 [Dothidotthia symphoricarpi CBS 119687]|uniref:Uncharacterized protein n=1 Tax=Dothidotthia symphoricarpi CBS 119687 TaxID=1392245 RepID=A0A6A6ABJ3_9PLEO|nr:uncharacterized protein P153DRAFT_343515 [Dothidotthia symphoricarpi CBS 119687]KAF2128227.1 hypothetical protein P153DRAFT_343515 [Dothidotthia symphoricarpi CBS 119687]